jgi:hypothetical protein
MGLASEPLEAGRVDPRDHTCLHNGPPPRRVCQHGNVGQWISVEDNQVRKSATPQTTNIPAGEARHVSGCREHRVVRVHAGSLDEVVDVASCLTVGLPHVAVVASGQQRYVRLNEAGDGLDGVFVLLGVPTLLR